MQLQTHKWSVHAPVALPSGNGHWVSIIRRMGVGSRTGLIVAVMKDKVVVFPESLRYVSAFNSCFTTDVNFSGFILLGVLDSVYCHHIEHTGCV